MVTLEVFLFQFFLGASMHTYQSSHQYLCASWLWRCEMTDVNWNLPPMYALCHYLPYFADKIISVSHSCCPDHWAKEAPSQRCYNMLRTGAGVCIYGGWNPWGLGKGSHCHYLLNCLLGLPSPLAGQSSLYSVRSMANTTAVLLG